MNKQYNVLAYTGLAWLKPLGVFDSFDEAQEALSNEYYRQAEQTEGFTPDEFTAFDESFWSMSRIEEQ